MKFENLHFPEAPIITGNIPGKKAQKILTKQERIEGTAVSYPKAIPLVLDEGRGATLKDSDGNIFIDFFAGAGVVALGYNNPIILRAVEEQLHKISHTLDFPTEVRVTLVERIREILPGKLKNNMKVQFGGPTGSDAVEMALKFVKSLTQRRSFISFEGAYHGMTSGALSLTSGRFWKEQFTPLLPDIHFLPYAYCFRCPFNREFKNCGMICAQYYNRKLTDPHSGIVQPAGTIIEPIQGEGGSIIPPEGFVKKIENISRQYDIPLIFDEIQSGFNRTGKFFSFEHDKAIPDIITMSKAIGGGFPLSAIAYREDLDKKNKWTKGAHIGTFRGNVTAMAAGVATIDFMIENDLSTYVTTLGQYMLQCLKKIEKSSAIIGEVRGKGLMIGLEIVTDKETNNPSEELAKLIRLETFNRGVILELGGHYNNVLRILPPLIITKDLVDKGIDILKSAIESIEYSK
ncbi:MAG: aspartate aminotransferase family protein [Candidatus Hodarchaeales archaeon]|jgi:diaminobutyrate-2-oxoglutarate transaminase